MPWYKLSDDESLNRKVRPLSDGAYRLNHHAGQYCSRHLTDGLVWLVDWEEVVLGIKAKRIKDCVAELVSARLWHEPGETCDSPDCPAAESPCPEGAWIKHDYWEYQPRRVAVLEQREKARTAGRMGGFAKRIAKRNASETLGGVPSETPSDRSTNARGRPGPVPVSKGFTPLATSRPLTREAQAICDAWLARGRQLTVVDRENVEGMVGDFRVLMADEFVAEMESCDQERAEQGLAPIRRVMGYRERFRRLNDRLRDEGRRPRDAPSVLRAAGSGMVGVGAVL